MTTVATRMPTPGVASTPLALEVQVRPLPQSPDLFFEAGWRDLERRSLHANPFLSPSLVLSSSELAAPGRPTQLLTVMDADGRWYAAGLFESVTGSRQLPAPHLQAVRGPHSYLTGLLLDSTRSSDAIEAIWSHLDDHGLHGLAFPQFPFEGRLGDLLAAHCAARSLTSLVDGVQYRASVSRRDTDNTLGISEKRSRSLQKGRKALARHGEVSFRLRGSSRDDQSAIDQFLHLESLGWKGEEGSALASCRSDSRWFRSITTSLSDADRVRFAELTVDDQIIASLCLLRSQSEYFAFKIGWDPQFERGCPGFLIAAELRSRLGELPGCARIDGCARPGSFLDHVWPGRIAVGDAMFTTNRLGSMMATGTQWARALLRRWRGIPQTTPAHPASTPAESTPSETPV